MAGSEKIGAEGGVPRALLEALNFDREKKESGGRRRKPCPDGKLEPLADASGALQRRATWEGVRGIVGRRCCSDIRGACWRHQGTTKGRELEQHWPLRQQEWGVRDLPARERASGRSGSMIASDTMTIRINLSRNEDGRICGQGRT